MRITCYSALDDLPPDASELFATAATLFETRWWWSLVAAHGIPQAAEPRFVVCAQGGVAAAVFPLLTDSRTGELTALVMPYTCHYAPLLRAGLSTTDRMAAFSAFARFCRQYSVTRLDALDIDSSVQQECARAALSARLLPIGFAHFGNWYEPVAGMTWQEYLAGRPGALRETIRRKLRRAERDPCSAFRVFSTPAEIENGIAAYEDVYRRSWKQPEPFPTFNPAFIRVAAGQGILRLGIYSQAAVPIAAQMWVVDHTRALVLKLAHDEAYKALSPGTVLTALMLHRLLDEEHVTEIDFGRGDDAYKREWASKRRQRVGVMLVNPCRPRGLRVLTRHLLGRLRSLARRAPADRF